MQRSPLEAASGTSVPPPCQRCGGPHQFDTSVPSPLWNRVIRDGGLPDYLCTTCIVLAFVNAGVSFEAELYGEPVNRADTVPVISVRVGDRPADESYGDLREALRDANQIIAMTREHLRRDHPECAYAVLGIMNDGTRRALAALPDGNP